MEINKKLIVDKPIKIGEYNLIPVAEIYTGWWVGKGGYYSYFQKRPIALILQSTSSTEAMTVDGEPLPKNEISKYLPYILEAANA